VVRHYAGPSCVGRAIPSRTTRGEAGRIMGVEDEPTTAVRPRAVLLGGYAAKSCPRVIHNEYDVTVPEVDWTPPADLQRLFDLGNAFEADVLARWADLGLDGFVDLRSLDADKPAHIAATVEAMRA